MDFTLLFPATFFGSFFRSHLQTELYFLKNAIYTIDYTIVDFDISHYTFKIVQN